jgi:UDP-N-acetylmuramoyl-L-alanyl-D-glutamate--2,6-diaminopimelate ligase
MIMKFNELVKQKDLRIIAAGGNGDPDISGITCDSRTVEKGDLFVAIPGTKTQGDAYVADALRRGAAAVVSGSKLNGASVPWAQVENPRRALGLLGKALWGVNVDAMQVVGITGTNGKTTTAHLFTKLFEQRFGPEHVWMFGTIDFKLGSRRQAASHTTPEALDVFRLIGGAAEKVRPQAVVMEVSSHSLALDRVGGLVFDAAVFTNLTQDHLDFHETMENYYQAKKRLFTDFLKKDGRSVVNIDDPYGRRLAGEIGGSKCLTFGKSKDADVRIVDAECSWDGTAVELATQGKRLRVRSALRGFFNVYNLAGFCAGATALSFDGAAIKRACAAIETVPGRMDRVALDAPFSTIVDYAHTPDALVNILRTSRPLTKGRLICVFGCGGDRDRTKRPLMGKAVAEFSDEAVVTSDNPRSERPEAILQEILAGMPLDFPHTVIADRRQAIKKALAIARPGDCVVIAGKGHETYQEIQGVKHPFNDKEIVLKAYEELAAHEQGK